MSFVKHCLCGKQGDHQYFQTNLTWGELESMVAFQEDLGDLDEDKEMQRRLTRTRIGRMSDYLTDNDDHFFSAVTLMMLPRDLGQSVESGKDYRFECVDGLNDHFGLGEVGQLYLSGNIKLFPADGQHRLRAGFRALKAKPALADEAIPAVLLPYVKPDQVRQLFSDLNLDAKPASKSLGYAYETRDPTVRAAKAVMDRVDLFVGRVNQRSNSLPRSSANVITLNALVAGTKEIVSALAKSLPHRSVEDFLADQDQANAEVAEVWQRMVDAFDSYWEPVINEEAGAAGRIRDTYVFPHGLGWQALAKVAARLISDHGPSAWYADFVEKVGKVEWTRQNSDGMPRDEWQNVAMVEDRINNTGPGIKATASFILGEKEENEKEENEKVEDAA